jgi:hypothetical protein
MNADDLRADCARCAALCCVAPAFDRSAEFAYDKPADTPCRHLAGDDRCAIHAGREGAGFSGCVLFDCYGAGQRIVQELYGGRSWRDDPDLLAEMSRCFFALRRVHELLMLLGEAAKLDLSAPVRETLEEHRRRLDPDAGWSPAALLSLDLDRMNLEARAFLGSLRPYLKQA